jgi:excisionase family DNA binding protein
MKKITHTKTALLTAEEMAGILGISEFTLKKLAREKQIPHMIISRRYRFSLEQVLKYFRKLEGGAA